MFSYYVLGGDPANKYMKNVFRNLGISTYNHNNITDIQGLFICKNNYVLNRNLVEEFISLRSTSFIFESDFGVDLYNEDTEILGFILNYLDFAYIDKSHINEIFISKNENRIKGISNKFLSFFSKNIQSVVKTNNGITVLNEKSIASYILGTKAETLENLRPIITKSQILNIVKIKFSAWKTDQVHALNIIHNEFNNCRVAVRSSSKNEDSWNESNAGGFKTFLNIDCNNISKLSSAIVEVFESYNEFRHDDHILIQPMMSNVEISGVLMTRCLNTKAPYYYINYDDSGESTNSITSGENNYKTLIVNRNSVIDNLDLPIFFKNLLMAVKEIEEILSYDSLDIEFGINSSYNIYIFQVRPIVFKKMNNSFCDTHISNAIEEIKEFILPLQKPMLNLHGEYSIFGVMPDAHPAELIGIRPKPMAYSLYKYFITDEVFSSERFKFGYKNVHPYPLMINLYGHPYVDTRVSFNSMVPSSLDSDLAEKIVSGYLQKLECDFKLHDKIEFDILLTNWIYGLDDEINDRFGDYLSLTEKNEFRESLITITNNAIKNTIDKEIDLYNILNQFETIVTSDISNIEKSHLLITTGKKLCAGSFVYTARAAFVASSILRSFINGKVLSQFEFDSFMRSLNTVTIKMEKLAYQVKIGESELKEFIKEFGHLRPGTYDVSVPAYFEKIDSLILPIIESAKLPRDHKFSWGSTTIDNIESIFKNNGIDSNIKEFEEFCRKTLTGRENLKFMYTKYLSYGLFYLKKWGIDLGINAHRLSYIDWSIINDIATNNKIYTESDFNKVIDEEIEKHLIASSLELPIIFRDINSLNSFIKDDHEPNFVTINKVISDICLVESDHPSDQLFKNLKGKIALIPRADPGFDWLFSQGIVGLITMYGGGNSHMSIRSAEQGIPAAVGIGESMYEKLKHGKKISLDCFTRKITII